MADSDVLFRASVDLLATKDYVYAMASAAVADLTDSHGAAGDDTTAHTFADVYEPAARIIVEGISAAGEAIGLTASKLLIMAINYLEVDDRVAANLTGGIDASTFAAKPRQPECEKQRVAQGLPMMTGSKEIHEIPVIGQFWPQGDPDRLNHAADVWRKLAKLIDDAQHNAHRHVGPVPAYCEGPAVEALQTYVKKIYTGTPSEGTFIGEGQPLMENLSAACRQLSRACADYAEAIHTARSTLIGLAVAAGIITAAGVLLTVFTLGGSDAAAAAADAALVADAAVAAETLAVAAESAVAGTVVAEAESILTAELVRLTAAGLLTATATAAAGVFVGSGIANAGTSFPPSAMPSPAVGPTLPAPAGSGRFPPYSIAEAAAATAWLATLPTRDALYGTADDRAYQIRVAGHPERQMPTGLPPGGNSSVWADGFRPSDGAVIDAKHVRDPGCTPRTLDAINEGRFALKFTLDKDEREISRYALVIANPANSARYLEIDTDDQASIAYWAYLTAKFHVPNDVRYMP